MKKQIILLSSALMLTFSLLCSTSYSQTNKAYGDNMAKVDSILVGNSYQYIYAIYTGDINQDGFIDVFDFPEYDNDNLNLVEGYAVTDLNGDGFVDVFDFPVFDNNNLNLVQVMRPF
jgi:hypothetical protein